VDSPQRQIGRYVLCEAIASGGMATVYVGRLVGTAGFSRTVAIKRLHAHLAENPGSSSVLIDEARLGGRIRHPNVVSTLDVMADSDELFVVMDYVHGSSLAMLAAACAKASERVPIAVSAAIIAGVLHGLHAAHETKGSAGEPLGLVHRDVSPQNILVGVDGVPRIADFGIAKAKGRAQATTQEGAVKGKLGYMSIEQLSGSVVDRRADIYAAGVVLWELLTGRHLFVGEHYSDTVRRVLAGRVETPASVTPDVPAALDEIVMRALDGDPSRRFDTARQMAVAIENATRLATASEIGEWVEMTAGPDLARRAALVRAIETSAPDRAVPSSELPTQTVATARPRTDGAASPRATGAVVLAAAAAAIALATIAAVVSRRTTSRPSGPPVADAPVVAPAPSTSDKAQSPLTGAPESAPTASQATSPTTAPRAPRIARPGRRADPHPASAKAACNPPYTIDSAGVRHYKPECPLE
jgi:serine/threonine-protein kinase